MACKVSNISTGGGRRLIAPTTFTATTTATNIHTATEECYVALNITATSGMLYIAINRTASAGDNDINSQQNGGATTITTSNDNLIRFAKGELDFVPYSQYGNFRPLRIKLKPGEYINAVTNSGTSTLTYTVYSAA